ncbi:MAG: dihydrofolate reductase [Phycisphaeraceae bacterium]|nr:dihydrofolate reductase [Phycisphaeraceae bacterium]
MRVSMIVAAGENGVIGCEGRLPWHLSEDLKRFRRLTTGHAVIMGRRTYESIGKPLPQRRNIILSRSPDYHAEGVEVVATFDAAMTLCAADDEAFIIGGAEIYRLALPHVERLYLTRVHQSPDGDAFLPDIDWTQWRLISEEPHDQPIPHRYQVWDRR